MLIALVVLAMVAIAAYEVPIMIRIGAVGELRVFIVLWVSGLALGIMQTVGVPLPNPTDIIIQTMPPLARGVSKLLGL